LYDYCIHLQKAALPGNENSVGVGGGIGGFKSGRRRWGHTVAKTPQDSWEEYEPSETAASNSKKPSLVKAEEEGSLKEHHPQ